MTKSQRSFMFGNRDAALNELHLCPTAMFKKSNLDLVFSVLIMTPQSAALWREDTHDFNQFGPRKNAPLQF